MKKIIFYFFVAVAIIFLTHFYNSGTIDIISYILSMFFIGFFNFTMAHLEKLSFEVYNLKQELLYEKQERKSLRLDFTDSLTDEQKCEYLELIKENYRVDKEYLKSTKPSRFLT